MQRGVQCQIHIFVGPLAFELPKVHFFRSTVLVTGVRPLATQATKLTQEIPGAGASARLAAASHPRWGRCGSDLARLVVDPQTEESPESRLLGDSLWT